jgi:PAS domain S-box-containing protein
MVGEPVLLDALPGCVWTALPDGNFDFVNQRWCDYTGLSLDQARGRGWQTAIHPEDLRDVLEPGEIEARVRRFDGSIAGSASPSTRCATQRDRSSSGVD